MKGRGRVELHCSCSRRNEEDECDAAFGTFISESQREEDAGLIDGCSVSNYSDVVGLLLIL